MGSCRGDGNTGVIMENFWDQRFSEDGFAYGEAPNVFLREQLRGREPGALLLPAEGEGRYHRGCASVIRMLAEKD
jgi:hypothetical protein